jgi:exodeoxyribonuclease VII large subunit
VWNKTELLEKLENLRHHLLSRMDFLVSSLSERLDNLLRSRVLRNPAEILDQRSQEVDDLMDRLSLAGRRAVETKQHCFQTLAEKLNLLSPLNVLGRGYAICWKQDDGEIATESASLRENDAIKIRLKNGEFTGIVKEVL